MINKGLNSLREHERTSYIWVNRYTCLNGTSRSEGDGNHLEDNIPKTPQLAYFPIAGYSEYQRKQNQGEKKLATG